MRNAYTAAEFKALERTDAGDIVKLNVSYKRITDRQLNSLTNADRRRVDKLELAQYQRMMARTNA